MPPLVSADTVEARDEALATLQHLPFAARVTTLVHATAYEIALTTRGMPESRYEATLMAIRQLNEALAFYTHQFEQKAIS